jgi:hypothetical protein
MALKNQKVKMVEQSIHPSENMYRLGTSEDGDRK